MACGHSPQAPAPPAQEEPEHRRQHRGRSSLQLPMMVEAREGQRASLAFSSTSQLHLLQNQAGSRGPRGNPWERHGVRKVNKQQRPLAGGGRLPRCRKGAGSAAEAPAVIDGRSLHCSLHWACSQQGPSSPRGTWGRRLTLRPDARGFPGARRHHLLLTAGGAALPGAALTRGPARRDP